MTIDLNALQEKHNRRMANQTKRGESHIYIGPKGSHNTHPHESGKAMLHRTTKHARVGKMHGAIDNG